MDPDENVAASSSGNDASLTLAANRTDLLLPPPPFCLVKGHDSHAA